MPVGHVPQWWQQQAAELGPSQSGTHIQVGTAFQSVVLHLPRPRNPSHQPLTHPPTHTHLASVPATTTTTHHGCTCCTAVAGGGGRPGLKAHHQCCTLRLAACCCVCALVLVWQALVTRARHAPLPLLRCMLREGADSRT